MFQEYYKTGYRILIGIFILVFGCTPGTKLRNLLTTVCDDTFDKKEQESYNPVITKTDHIITPSFPKDWDVDKITSMLNSPKYRLENYGDTKSKQNLFSNQSFVIAENEVDVSAETNNSGNKKTDHDNKKVIVKDFFLSAEPDRYRLTISLNQFTRFTVKTLEKPYRLYIDIENSILNHKVPHININDGFVHRIRSGQFNENTARLVVDLKDQVDYVTKVNQSSKEVYIEFASRHPNMQVEKRSEPKFVMTANKEKEIPGANYKNRPPHETTLAQELGLKVNTIIIDAGHGGKDPGALGSSGLQEKDVTLDIAKKLAHLLQKDNAYKVHLTRHDDSYIPLEERTAYANRMNGDLFVSIHVNAHREQVKNGIETYILSLAQDDEARAVAAFENTTANISFSDLNNILTDIIKSSKMSESHDFAQNVQKNLITKTHQNDRGVRKAGFVVLVGARMPSILVEIGFITNKKEEQLLKNRYYRQMVAEAVYNGIKEYSNMLVNYVQQ